MKIQLAALTVVLIVYLIQLCKYLFHEYFIQIFSYRYFYIVLKIKIPTASSAQSRGHGYNGVYGAPSPSHHYPPHAHNAGASMGIGNQVIFTSMLVNMIVATIAHYLY